MNVNSIPRGSVIDFKQEAHLAHRDAIGGGCNKR